MTTVVNFKTETKIKTQAQKIARAMGLNLSDILNIYLREFIQKKEVYINLNQDETNPSAELLAAVKASRKDYQTGKLKRFKSVGSLVASLE